MERRGRERCPVCQGPTRTVENGKGGLDLRCRNSICAYNHRRQACPRCRHVGAEVTLFEDDTYSFNCPECQNTWKQPVAFIERS